MPYSRPPLTDLRDQVLQDINGAQITGPGGVVLLTLLQKALLRILGYAEAGMVYEAYAYLDWISKQSVPFTATGEFLAGWAALKRLTADPATQTRGTITLVGSPDGLSKGVASGTSVARSGDGAVFTTTADGLVVGAGPVTVPIIATVAGAGGNFDANTVFTLINPIAGVTSASTASAQVTVGADAELDDAFRARMLQVYASPPQGGDRQDYIEWAGGVPGVTRAWVAPNANGPGTVVVYVMLDLAEAAHAGFPQGTFGVATAETRDADATGDQLTVANAIFPVQPVTALVYVAAPSPGPIDFTVADLGVNNTAANQAAISAALADMFLRLGNVGGTVDPATGAVWPAIEPSAWYAALEGIQGLSGFKVTVPAAAFSATAGSLPVLGTVTFVT